ncbi:hypothetical protein DICSQDRAFT_59914, partial [Dichomitus squalens LYAD-421 SS1]
RSAQVHVAHARAWKAHEDKKERDAYFKLHGSRWSELMRLPYYDCVAMTVIDPMHNLLLGTLGFRCGSMCVVADHRVCRCR